MENLISTVDDSKINEDLLITQDFLARATTYLNSLGIEKIETYSFGTKKEQDIRKQPAKEYGIKEFFIKLCHTFGLYSKIVDKNLQNDLGFALLCIEEQPMCYNNLPETVQKDLEVIELCSSTLKNYDVKNKLKIDQSKFSIDDISLLLKIKLLTKYNSDIFPKLSRDYPEILKTNNLKEIIKYNPNIIEFQKQLKNEPDVINFINELPLADGSVRLRRIIGKKIDDSFFISNKDKVTFAKILEKQNKMYSLPYVAVQYLENQD